MQLRRRRLLLGVKIYQLVKDDQHSRLTHVRLDPGRIPTTALWA